MSSASAARESDELDGVWAGAGIGYDGKVIDTDETRHGRITVADGVITVWREGQPGYAYRLGVTLRPHCSPREIDCLQIVTEGETPFIDGTVAGIYELAGDRLTVCTWASGRPGRGRPTLFDAGADDEQSLAMFSRVRAEEQP